VTGCTECLRRGRFEALQKVQAGLLAARDCRVPEYDPGVCDCRWAAGDLHEWSAISYPDALHAYAESEFEVMKQMQADLLGIKNSPRAKL